ncbi:hypothetical protein HMPREF9089_00525 [Eubacterium brachy ATCC 33089]|nr:hypothetical protein HMPREF9089_00525 [Eubacterium brachy ATCC 33089]
MEVGAVSLVFFLNCQAVIHGRDFTKSLQYQLRITEQTLKKERKS